MSGRSRTPYDDLDGVDEWLNVMPTELTDAQIKDILIKLIRRVQSNERETARAANVASCLANGIRPD